MTNPFDRSETRLGICVAILIAIFIQSCDIKDYLRHIDDNTRLIRKIMEQPK